MQLLDVPRFAPALMDLLRCLTLPHGRAAKAAGSANANDRCPVHSDPSLDDVDDGGATEIAPGGGRVRVNNGNGNGTGKQVRRVGTFIFWKGLCMRHVRSSRRRVKFMDALLVVSSGRKIFQQNDEQTYCCSSFCSTSQ